MKYRMEGITQLSREQKKVLKRAADKSIISAIKSLPQMMDMRVEMEISMIDFLSPEDVPRLVGGPETLAVGIYLRMMGDIGGTSLLVLSRESALSLVDLLYGRDPGTTEVLTQDDRSALGEIGNILTACYLTELGNSLGITLYHSTPCIVFDIANSLIDFVLRGSDKRIENVLVIQLKFKGKGCELNGSFLLLFDPSYLNVLVNKIDRKLSSC